MIYRSQAPLRISFAGGGTDVSPYPETRGGAVLSTTIDMYAYATAAARADGLIRLVSLDLGQERAFTANDFPSLTCPLRILVGAVSATGAPAGGVTLSVRTDAAPGSGLGSSSSVAVAALGALLALRGRHLAPSQLAELAYRVERQDCGIPGGRQDQYAAAYGGLNYIEFGSGPARVQPVPAARRTLLELQHNLLLCFTGQARTDSGIIGRQRRGFEAGHPEVLDALDGLRRQAHDMRRCLAEGDIRGFANLLNAGWQHKKRLAQGISDPHIDELHDAAMRCGAIGGKLLGAGGGGFMLLCCPDYAQAPVRQAVHRLGGEVRRFRFVRRGLETWRA
jgi:D-glycero-alpha-D-manno-heptose-7-phosphate kinase